MSPHNLAIISEFKREKSDLDFKDGEDDGGASHTVQLTIDVVENGFILSKNDSEEITQKVFLFDGRGKLGPQALVQTIIEDLGLLGKVRIQKEET